jgi:glyoxylase-like metal-dependent hydrolase (beta-lactamase superfamily II)
LNHQDPDVIGNAATLCEANPNISVMVTEEVWRLAQHLRIKPARVHFANKARSELTIIGDQHRWRLVPTPFCHFRGAMAFYDPELRTLFSGDLFGGLNRVGQVHLHATEADWPGVAQFHQIYMPTRESLRYAVRQIQALQPRVEIIAPQHGHVISGDLVPQFLERMHDLLVGQDLLALEEDESFLERYRGVLERLIARATEFMGREECLGRLKNPGRHDGIEQLVRWQGDDLVLYRDGYTAVAKLFTRLAQDEPLPLANALRSAVLDACCDAEIPIPPVGAGVEEDQSPQTVGPDGIQTQAWWLT